MNLEDFAQQYPAIASLLGDDWWSKADPHHPVRFSVIKDNRQGLNYYSRLFDRTPFQDIASQYENDLYTRRGFDSFFSELIGYIATEQWLCDSPEVSDVKGTSGLPEYSCDNLDVEVACIRASREVDRIRIHLVEQLDCEYTLVIQKKRAYNNFASDKDSWTENEDQVDEVISKIGQISEEDLPVTVVTDALDVEVLSKYSEKLGGIFQSETVRVVPDENEKIATSIEQKSSKCREGSPLIIFVDLNIETVDYAREVVEKVIGEPYGYARQEDVEISNTIQNTDNVWKDYLTDVGALPDKNKDTYTAIPPGNEGVFASETVSGVAGVMVRFHTGEVTYVPNVYTEEIDSRKVFDGLGWGIETKTLKPSDI